MPSAPWATMPSNRYYKRTRRQTRRTRPSALDQIADLPRPVPRPRSLRCDPREHQLVLALHQAQTKAQRALQAIDGERVRVPIERYRNRLQQRVPRPGGKARARPTFPEKFGTAPPMNQGFLVLLLAAGLAACVDNATGRQWALPPHPVAPGWGRIYVLLPYVLYLAQAPAVAWACGRRLRRGRPQERCRWPARRAHGLDRQRERCDHPPFQLAAERGVYWDASDKTRMVGDRGFAAGFFGGPVGGMLEVAFEEQEAAANQEGAVWKLELVPTALAREELESLHVSR
jgi:hypothetical protein